MQFTQSTHCLSQVRSMQTSSLDTNTQYLPTYTLCWRPCTSPALHCTLLAPGFALRSRLSSQPRTMQAACTNVYAQRYKHESPILQAPAPAHHPALEATDGIDQEYPFTRARLHESCLVLAVTEDRMQALLLGGAATARLPVA